MKFIIPDKKVENKEDITVNFNMKISGEIQNEINTKNYK